MRGFNSRFLHRISRNCAIEWESELHNNHWNQIDYERETTKISNPNRSLSLFQTRKKLIDEVAGERILSKEMGGEIYQLIERLDGVDFTCIGHVSTYPESVGIWYGYPHCRGLADGEGNRWWAYQKCEISGYKTAWWKVERLASTENNSDKRENIEEAEIGPKNSVQTASVENYYRLLCIEYDANQLQIKKNYRFFVKRFHPDSSPDEKESDLELMKSINAAYDVLSDPKARSRYDRSLKRISKFR